MTDANTALQELLAKVDAGRWSTIRDEPSAETGLLIYWEQFDLIMSEGSLDAALALHNAVLPGFLWKLDCSNATVYPLKAPDTGSGFYGMSDSPARAWLCAILKALIAECDE